MRTQTATSSSSQWPRALVWLLGCVSSVLVWGCKDTGQLGPRGSLVVAVQTDMAIPGGLDRVRFQVHAEDGPLHDETFAIAPTGDVELPITLTLFADDLPEEPVEISVVGLLEGEPRVMAQAVTRVPREREALLQLPLSWLCVGSAKQISEDEFESTCEPEAGIEQVCRAGSCQSARIEDSALPDFDAKDVYGGGDSPSDEDASCFDAAPCFDRSMVLDPDAECIVTLPLVDRAPSLGLVLADDSAGVCGELGCYIPLDLSEQFGFSLLEPEQGSGPLRAALPKVVCEQLADGRVEDVVASTTCPAKTPSTPTCGAWSSVDRRVTVVISPQQPLPEDGGVETSDAGRPPSADAAASPLDAATPSADAGPATDASAAPEDEGVTVVLGRNPVELSVSPNTGSLSVGQSVRLTATVNYANGSTQDVSALAEWSSDAEDLLQVDDTGLVTAAAPGVAQITAALGELSAGASFEVAVDALEPAGLVLSPQAAVLSVGDTQEFTALVLMSDGSTTQPNSECAWSSSDPLLGEFATEAAFTALAPGQVVVFVECGGLFAEADVEISAAELIGLAIVPSEVSVAIGQSVALRAEAAYSDGTFEDVSAMVTWWSEAPDVVSVDEQGTIVGVSATQAAVVFAELGEFVASAVAVVTEAALVSLEISPEAPSLALGTSAVFSAVGTFSDGSIAAVSATWSIDDPEVASVVDGAVEALSIGDTTLRAAAGGLQATSPLSVVGAGLVQLTLSPLNPTLEVGADLQFTLLARYSDGQEQNVANAASWSSSDTNVAALSSTGRATGVAAGPSVIRATYEGLTAQTNLTVTGATLVAVQVSPASATLSVGGSVALQARALYSDESSVDVTAQATWSSEDSEVASVAGGVVTALGAGGAQIDASFGGFSDSAEITVNSLTPVALRIQPEAGSVDVGQTFDFVAIATYSDESTQVVTQQATWGSNNLQIASVSAGRATGVSAGAASISASFGELSATARLSVRALQRVDITPASVELRVGDQAAFTVTATYTDGSTRNVTSECQWSVSDPKSFEVNASGTVRALAPGSGSVNFRYGNFTGGAKVQVLDLRAVALRIDPGQASFFVGQTLTLRAIALLGDKSERDVTSSATWVSGARVITVNAGVVSALASGQTTITATYENLQAEAAVSALSIDTALTPVRSPVAAPQ